MCYTINDMKTLPKTLAVLLIVLTSLFSGTFVLAQMSGGAYEIYADVVSYIGGGDGLTSNTANRLIYDTGSGMAIVTSSGGVYELRAGFQAQEIGLLTLSLSSSTINFGQLSTSTVSTATTTITVSTDSETGYSVSISEDGNLRDGSGNTINDVSDGAVTAGEEEYGFLLSGTDVATSTVQALSGSATIATATGTINQHQFFVQFQVAISTSTVTGSYSHTVQFTSTVNP